VRRLISIEGCKEDGLTTCGFFSKAATMKFPLALVLVFLVAGCAKRPAELQRFEQLDGECQGRGAAFLYATNAGPGIGERAVKAGCIAPVGAWTDDKDPARGGTRKLAYDLREKQQSFLCCKP
jgi:hypothetical protein